jgi:hypothetical protein
MVPLYKSWGWIKNWDTEENYTNTYYTAIFHLGDEAPTEALTIKTCK